MARRREAEQPALPGFEEVVREEWERHWVGMPRFDQKDLAPWKTAPLDFGDGTVYVHFEKEEDATAYAALVGPAVKAEEERLGHFPTDAELGRQWFSRLLGLDITKTLDADTTEWDTDGEEDDGKQAGLFGADPAKTSGPRYGEGRKRTQSIWYPEAEIGRFAGKAYVSANPRVPRFPIYLPTKGRWESRLTARALDGLGVPYIEVVEPQQRDAYLRAGSREDRLLVLPESDRGLVFVRNWIWDHAEASGVPYFWTMDDNIMGFYRLQENLKTPVGDGTIIWAIEEMTTRYSNVGIAGMNYFMFASRKAKRPPVYINSRVYSNMLLPTALREADGRPFRNDPALRFNDDTDLNLRVLKPTAEGGLGMTTLLFNAFLIFKASTMTVKGGMDYQRSEKKEDDDRYKASKQLADKHPEAKVIRRWGRWHHTVDYSRFRANRLRLRDGVALPSGPDDFGMYLRIEDPKAAPAPAPAPKRDRYSAAPPLLVKVGPIGVPDAKPVGDLPTVQVAIFDGLRQGPVPDGWLPDSPPDLSRVDEVGLDFETTGLRWWGDRPVGVGVAWREDGRVVSRYLPFAHRGGGNLDEEVVRRWARAELRGKRIVNLNTKFDLHFLVRWLGLGDLDDLGASSFGDVAFYAALLDDHRGEGWRRSEKPFSLEALGLDYVGEGKVQGLDGSRIADYHAYEVTPYGRKDPALVLRILDVQRPLLREERLEKVATLEDRVIPVVVEMEANAARIDVEKLRRWLDESERKLTRLRTELASEVGWNVNPDSPDDMARLFRTLGIEHSEDEMTETGRESFAADVLQKHATVPAIARVIRVSRLADLRSKFLIPYGQAVGDDGLLRFEFHQLKGDRYGTVSGRFSSTKPAGAKKGGNVQQVFAVENQIRMHCADCAAVWGKIKTKDQVSIHRAEHEDVYLVRELFIAEPGLVTGASDAKQIEYRVFAHLTKSERLIQAYRDDPETDFHAWTSELIRKYRPDFERKRLKIVNFAVLFGSGVANTCDLLGVDEDEGKKILGVYNQLFPEARTLMRDSMDYAKEHGFVRTIAGRKARYPRGADGSEPRRLYTALNRRVSGGAADLNKRKLVTVYERRKDLGLKMRLTVHDELVGDIPAENLPALSRVMDEQDVPLRVPIIWDTKSGRNWSEAK